MLYVYIEVSILKKVVFIILLCICFFCLLFGQNRYMSSLQTNLSSGLNGSSIENLSVLNVVKDELKNFQDKYYVDADSYIVLCEDVDLYKEYVLFREKNLSVDPFCVIENLPDYKKEYDLVVNYYNSECRGVEDSRVKYENNKYLIRYGDINFDSEGIDVIQYDTFEFWVLKKDFVDITKQEAEINQNIDFIDYEVENNRGLYFFYDNLKQQEIVVSVYSLFGFVLNCDIEVGE